MKVFVTGGAGYIGTHTVLELLRDGHEVCVSDNYRNSSPVALDRVRRLANADFRQCEVDIRDQDTLTQALCDFQPDCFSSPNVFARLAGSFASIMKQRLVVANEFRLFGILACQCLGLRFCLLWCGCFAVGCFAVGCFAVGCIRR